EQDTELGSRAGQPVPARAAGGERADASHQDEAEGEVGGEHRGHVHVHDALDIALHGLARGIAEARPQPGDEGEDSEAPQDSRRARAHASRMNSKVRSPITRYTRSAPGRGRSQGPAS